ncbi:hypothetical protein A2567_01075 [Candidatus Azambacteria bacterium RIFOXYD1_FULL_42_11]|uniref:Uncharacterized protein n=4 Tax=Candidatus Azamiibacteriota TaxID=1752741 RepID=A0A0G0ZAI3_9BACT|nr:MAG: hypothetical protein UV07_C0007G0006 [Candidatus Azambacteria bacterium GW2011_GWB1_42_17]KKS45732.1 MAG: hypothetical protein UV10_C0015G0005 [Candidatus Azambacteria bacterium GW2011_GWA1_42_19]KKS75082.1 MAG: hypothetical protein UV48_C0019G0007 [Candidatus Azambacteria bacterium GW2011_GWA2_42_9]KKS88627.1 MAG: hypothetical protein UV62_C0004G0016 [Parcubacteria group bacterium GW2011_GWC1_43_11]OGD41823.1 MAG: hypothetical protein A2567_01075 [Candidatus Azambacteria bacterium RIFO
MQKIKEKPIFYALWFLTAVVTVFLGFGFMGASYNWWGFGISIWSFITIGIIAFPVITFEKPFKKLIIGLGGLIVFFFIILGFTRGSEALGILFGLAGIFIIFIPLFLVERFRYKKSSVFILILILILELVTASFIAPKYITGRYRTYKQFEIVDDIRGGKYSVSEAINKCGQIRDNNWALNMCNMAIAEKEKDVALCENVVDAPGMGNKNYFISACIRNVARNTHNSSLCYDKHITDDLERDICLFDTGAIKTNEDCLKLSYPYQRQRCEAGARLSY